MDSYPTHLAPIQNEEKLYKESFQTWWDRTKAFFPNVPRNVAKQWIHRHWGYSPYGWIKSSEVYFELMIIDKSYIEEIFISFDLQDPDETRRHGDYLRKLGKGLHGWGYALGAIMERRRTWPLPPIILDDAGSFSELSEYPDRPFLIEGHQRLSIMRSLIADGIAIDQHCCWLMSKR